MSTLSTGGMPNTGDTFTLAFTPTGLGNPFDSSTAWYNAVSSDLDISVSNVVFNGNIFVNDEIDVTIQWLGSSGSQTYQQIAGDFTNALNSMLWGYSFVGVVSGNASSLPSSTSTGLSNALSGLSSGVTTPVIWIGIGLVMLAVGVYAFKREVV